MRSEWRRNRSGAPCSGNSTEAASRWHDPFRGHSVIHPLPNPFIHSLSGKLSFWHTGNESMKHRTSCTDCGRSREPRKNVGEGQSSECVTGASRYEDGDFLMSGEGQKSSSAKNKTKDNPRQRIWAQCWSSHHVLKSCQVCYNLINVTVGVQGHTAGSSASSVAGGIRRCTLP